MIITQTPLRISFAGGLTDFPSYYRKNDGAVVSSTIDKYIYCMVKRRFDRKIVAHYTKLESVDEPDELQHDLIREALKLKEIKKGIEISTTADVPSTGSGLGSSSALTVGILHALDIYRDHLPTQGELAEQACWIELGILGSPIGKQDQYAAAFGGLNLISFQDAEKEVGMAGLVIDKVTQIKLNQNLMLFYTGLSKDSNEILSEGKANMKEKVRILDGIKGLVNQIIISLQKGYLDRFGEILALGWELKKQMASGTTNEKIDEIYDRAIHAGAEGGKITGSGGGGFLLLYCPIEEQDSVRKALKDLRELPFNLTNQGSSVIFNTGP